jgi:D-arabinose 1-dehydrogenase-like Zn-dependent alcohol dehydrogenase
MRAIVMNGMGRREMMEYVERPDPVPGPGEAWVEIAFADVHFMDIGVRQGVAWTEVPNPKILGVEGVGRVLAVGTASMTSSPAGGPRGSMRPEAMRSGSRSRLRRSCRFPTQAMITRRPR